jgi:sigma-54 dependent transcriptional regulator, acetoin dehydrogenase operon transcriptional activator AcoR
VRCADLPPELRAEIENGGMNGNPASAAAAVDALAQADPLQAAERAALLRIIAECAGNMTRVATRLGMSRNTLYRRVKRHGIPLARVPVQRLPGHVS